jgi:hypothetical protein
MARATIKRSAGAGKTNKAGRELLKAVREAHHAVTTGDFSGITIRDVEIPDPGEWGPDEVRALRHRLGVSHRLLDKINEDPEAYMESLIHRKAG